MVEYLKTHTVRRVAKEILFILASTLIFLQPVVTSALSASDLESILNGTVYYDPNSYESVCSVNTDPSYGIGTGKVFVVGDSLTYHMAANSTNSGQLLQKLSAAGYTVDTNFTTTGASTSSPRISGKSVEAQGGINVADTIPHLAEHPQDWADADIIVIALGTNREQLDFATEISELITSIRANNTKSNLQIYWVNTYFSVQGDAYKSVNEVIETSSKTNNFRVIDYAGAATIDASIAPEPYSTDSSGKVTQDGVHVGTAEGRQKKADWIISQLPRQATSSSGSSPSVGGYPVALANNTIPLNTSIEYGSGVWATGSSIYQSGLQPPYDIEMWAISVLRNIARKSGLPESQLVTQNKVLSLVAWARAEGGGVDGHVGDFNPLNTKGGSGELGGENQGDSATDSNSNGFPSFDKGVEGITRGLFNVYQSRVGSALINPNTTPEQFMYTIAGDFSVDASNNIVNNLESEYPGNLAWATASITGYVYNPTSTPPGVGNRSEYVNTLLSVLNYTRTHYEQVAGKLLNGSVGSPPPLVYSSTGATGATLPGCGASAGSPAISPQSDIAKKYIPNCNVNNGNAAIACTAIDQLSGIPYSVGAWNPSDPSPDSLDCSGLTGMAIYRTFKVDLEGLCSVQYKTSKYFQQIDVHSIQPGDFVGKGTVCTGAGGDGHIAIVVSYDASTKKLVTVEASGSFPSGIRDQAAGTYNVGLAADGFTNYPYEWAVRYIGPKN